MARYYEKQLFNIYVSNGFQQINEELTSVTSEKALETVPETFLMSKTGNNVSIEDELAWQMYNLLWEAISYLQFG